MKATKKVQAQKMKGATRQLSPKEKKALQSAIQSVHGQSDRLGLLNPLELEPVLIYSLEERRK
jgi:hypothetical protein